MPIYEMQCEDGTCGALFEILAAADEQVTCPYCGFSCKRLISASGVNTANQDADWIRSVTEVVDKESSKPEAREFLRHPTRDNMHNWMKAEGIRHYESGESLRPPKRDMSKINDHVMREYQERNA
jgi:putative FmdB family regulatory protein